MSPPSHVQILMPRPRRRGSPPRRQGAFLLMQPKDTCLYHLREVCQEDFSPVRKIPSPAGLFSGGKPFFLPEDESLCYSVLQIPSRSAPMTGRFLSVAFWLPFLVLSLGCGGAQPLAVPGTSEPRPPGDVAALLARWQQELAQDELRLPEAGADRPQVLSRLARTCFLLADHLPPERRAVYLDKGRHYAELLRTEAPARVEGYYWSSLSLCGTAEICGAGQALRLLPEIEERLERAAALDPAYDQGGPHRVLGRLYSEAPPWPISVGDLTKSLEHLRLAAQIAPRNSTNQLFLAETCLRLGKTREARQALRAVLSATEHAVWPPGLEKDRRKAQVLLRKLEDAGPTARHPL